MKISPTMDGYIAIDDPSWATARNSTVGASAVDSTQGNAYAIRSNREAARGGGYSYKLTRSFFHFDTSSINTPVETAALSLRGFTQDDADIIVVKATSDISSLGTPDYDAIDGWSTGDNSGNVTIYSVKDHPAVDDGVISYWNTSSHNRINLTHEAKVDMFVNDDLYLCVMDYPHDIKDVAPSGSYLTGFYFEESTTSDYRPYLDINMGNAINFGANF